MLSDGCRFYTFAASSSSPSSASASWLASFIAVSRTPTKFCSPVSVPCRGGQPDGGGSESGNQAEVCRKARPGWKQNAMSSPHALDSRLQHSGYWAFALKNKLMEGIMLEPYSCLPHANYQRAVQQLRVMQKHTAAQAITLSYCIMCCQCSLTV